MLVFLLLLLFSGCGNVPDFLQYPIGSKLTNITVKSDQNPGKYTIVCDIVAIFDKDLAKKLTKLTSVEYFKTVGTLHAMHSQDLSIWRIEHKPGVINYIKINWTNSPKWVCGLMLFCDYRGKGDHMKMIDKSTNQVILTLGKKQIMQLQEDKKVTDKSMMVLDPSKHVNSLILVD